MQSITMVDLKDRRLAERLRHGAGPGPARRAAIKAGRDGLVPLIHATQNLFASSKHGEEYSQRVNQSMARYERLREIRGNLYAIVMPAGHGKTHYAEKYGFVDVDDLIVAEDHNRLLPLRYDAMHGRSTWSKHNSLWIELLNNTLDLFDYSRPVIILVHHEETALEIGATILGALRLNRAAFELNISNRDTDNRFFSRQSYEGWAIMTKTPNKIDGLDNRSVERLIIKLLCINNLPVAAPCKFETNRNAAYSPICPLWVLKGEMPPDRELDMSELVALYEAEAIPREAVDYYVTQGYTKTSLDFGVTLNDWGPVMARIAAGRNEREDFDSEGDMMAIFPPREVKEASRANLTLRRLDETFAIFEHEDVYELCCHHVGEPHVFVTGLVAAWKGLMDQLEVAHLVAGWFCVGYDKWSRAMKDVHTLVRTSRFLMNTEITESTRQRLMYLDLLVGRASYIINETTEVDKRGGDTYASEHLSYDPKLELFTKAQYQRDFPVAVRTAYSRMKYSKQPKLKVQSFRDFYKRRKTWLTKGSLVYNHLPPEAKKTTLQALDAINNVLVEIEARHNKQSLFEEMELRELLKYVGDVKDFNVTKTMVKYETGRKDRTLLPGSLIHFLVFTYVLSLAERLEQVGSVRLNALPDEDFLWFDRKITTGLYHVLYDWADFNEQHSADEMSLVISELDNVVQAPEDYTYFVQAIADSMYQMQLQDRDGRRYKLWKGLFSGWRGTTWVNGALNFCYVSVALICFERIYQYNPVVYIDEGGDDMDEALDSAVSMPRFMSIMDAMLFNANVWKQMFSTRTEFFRNTIVSGRAYASPTRALASFCAGDWEGAGNTTMRERVTNVLDQVGKMARRGVPHDFANGLAICALTHWCKLRVEDSWISMPREVIHGHIDDNGLGVPDWSGNVWRLSKKVPVDQECWLAILRPSKLSSRDYVEELAGDIESLSLELTKREQLATKFAEDAYDADLRLDSLNWASIVNFKAEITGKVPVVVEKVDERIFDDFLYFQVTDELIRKYTKASQYSELVGYITAAGRELTQDEIVAIVGEGRVSNEALNFGGNPYYRRLVPDFMGQKATYFCKEAINQGVADTDTAEEVFEILCYMASRVFGHSM